MDDLSISGEVINKTLREISAINGLLGGNLISLQSFKAIVKGKQKVRVADLGCGSGDIMMLMADYCRKNDIEASFVGIDANPFIIKYAEEQSAEYPEISFQCVNILDEEFKRENYDIIHCCLFIHHFTQEQLLPLFQQFKQQAEHVIINDLHRHYLAYWSIKVLTAIFSKSYMVKNDAAVSVKRGFSKADLESLMKEAEIETYQLKWKWAFRWQLSF
jgi:2-polyprenyl-3-methyl-5-hydroxy-6-metoxy-1,4-benzoquinol methylase